MKKHMLLSAVAAFGVLSMVLSLSVGQARAQTVFQAAGPTVESIQETVQAFRDQLGGTDNGNGAGPLLTGFREINWDGGGSTDTAPLPPPNPFNVFLNIRGGQFSTPGTGLTQAPPSGGAQGGLVVLFNNPTYATIFRTFSSPRLFTPVGSRITEGLFFVPGANPGVPSTPPAAPATVRAFGAVFTDVDKPDGDLTKNSTTIEYFGADGRRIYLGLVPPSPGDGNFSFFGLVFDDARIARVRITTGNSAPGPDDDARRDIVMMDNFIYAEPQPLP